MDSISYLLEQSIKWTIASIHEGNWEQVALGVILAVFAIGGIIYASKVYARAFEDGARAGASLPAKEGLFDAVLRDDKQEILSQQFLFYK